MIIRTCCILFLIGLLTQGLAQIDQTDLIKEKAVTKIKYESFVYNADSMKFFEMGIVSSDSIFEGLIIEKSNRQADGSESKTFYSYNNANLISGMRSGETSDFFSETLYDYDDANRLIKEVYRRKDKYGDFDSTSEFTYNPDGTINSKKTWQFEDENITRFKYAYKKGKLKSVKCIYKKRLSHTKRFIYNKKGLLASTHQEREERNSAFVRYTYNDKNQLVEEKHTVGSFNFCLIHFPHTLDRTDTIVFKYTYDEETGLLSKKEEHINGAPNAYMHLNYFY